LSIAIGSPASLSGDYRSGPAPVVAEASTLDAEMHLVSRGVGLSVTSEAVGLWYKRPGVTFVPILDLIPCSVSLTWWPQDTGLVAELAAVANEVRAKSPKPDPKGNLCCRRGAGRLVAGRAARGGVNA